MKISVVIPVLDDSSALRQCLISLESQVYGRNNLEVIVVDNGSEDDSKSVAHQYADRVLFTSRTKNPYIARNLGVKAARHNFLILLDAKCSLDPNSISLLLSAHQKYKPALSSGEISFYTNENSSIGEWVDAMVFVRAKEVIQAKEGLPGGSLWLFHKSLLQQIGWFREDMRSGADVEWTNRIWDKGLTIAYIPNAKVYYQPRRMIALLKKAKRIGKGHLQIAHRSRDFQVSKWLFGSILRMRPASPKFIRFCLNERLGTEKAPFSFFRLSMGIWLYRIFLSLGRLGL